MTYAIFTPLATDGSIGWRHAQAHANNLASYASQLSRIRSSRNVFFTSLRWPCAMTDATPCISRISRGVPSMGPARGTPRASTIIVAYRSARGIASFHNNSSILIKLFYYLLICCAGFRYTLPRLLNDTPSDADRLTISE
jgi:hypothetical protein